MTVLSHCVMDDDKVHRNKMPLPRRTPGSSLTSVRSAAEPRPRPHPQHLDGRGPPTTGVLCLCGQPSYSRTRTPTASGRRSYVGSESSVAAPGPRRVIAIRDRSALPAEGPETAPPPPPALPVMAATVTQRDASSQAMSPGRSGRHGASRRAPWRTGAARRVQHFLPVRRARPVRPRSSSGSRRSAEATEQGQPDEQEVADSNSGTRARNVAGEDTSISCTATRHAVISEASSGRRESVGAASGTRAPRPSLRSSGASGASWIGKTRRPSTGGPAKTRLSSVASRSARGSAQGRPGSVGGEESLPARTFSDKEVGVPSAALIASAPGPRTSSRGMSTADHPSDNPVRHPRYRNVEGDETSTSCAPGSRPVWRAWGSTEHSLKNDSLYSTAGIADNLARHPRYRNVQGDNTSASCAPDSRPGRRTQGQGSATPSVKRVSAASTRSPPLVQTMSRGLLGQETNNSSDSLPCSPAPDGSARPQPSTSGAEVSSPELGADSPGPQVAITNDAPPGSGTPSVDNAANVLESIQRSVDGIRSPTMSIVADLHLHSAMEYSVQPHEGASVEQSFLHTPTSVEVERRIAHTRNMLARDKDKDKAALEVPDVPEELSGLEPIVSDVPVPFNGTVDVCLSRGDVPDLVSEASKHTFHEIGFAPSQEVNIELCMERGDSAQRLPTAGVTTTAEDFVKVNERLAVAEDADVESRHQLANNPPPLPDEAAPSPRTEAGDSDFLTGDEDDDEESARVGPRGKRKEKAAGSEYATADEDEEGADGNADVLQLLPPVSSGIAFLSDTRPFYASACIRESPGAASTKDGSREVTAADDSTPRPAECLPDTSFVCIEPTEYSLDLDDEVYHEAEMSDKPSPAVVTQGGCTAGLAATSSTSCTGQVEGDTQSPAVVLPSSPKDVEPPRLRAECLREPAPVAGSPDMYTKPPSDDVPQVRTTRSGFDLAACGMLACHPGDVADFVPSLAPLAGSTLAPEQGIGVIASWEELGPLDPAPPSTPSIPGPEEGCPPERESMDEVGAPDQAALEVPDQAAVEVPDQGAAEVPDQGSVKVPDQAAVVVPDQPAVPETPTISRTEALRSALLRKQHRNECFVDSPDRSADILMEKLDSYVSGGMVPLMLEGSKSLVAVDSAAKAQHVEFVVPTSVTEVDVAERAALRRDTPFPTFGRNLLATSASRVLAENLPERPETLLEETASMLPSPPRTPPSTECWEQTSIMPVLPESLAHDVTLSVAALEQPDLERKDSHRHKDPSREPHVSPNERALPIAAMCARAVSRKARADICKDPLRRCSNCGEECEKLLMGAAAGATSTGPGPVQVQEDAVAARRRAVLAEAVAVCERELMPLNDTLARLQEKVRALDLPELHIRPRRESSCKLTQSRSNPRVWERPEQGQAGSATGAVTASDRVTVPPGAAAAAVAAAGAGRECHKAVTGDEGDSVPCPYCGLPLVPESALSPLARMYILLAQPVHVQPRPDPAPEYPESPGPSPGPGPCQDHDGEDCPCGCPSPAPEAEGS